MPNPPKRNSFWKSNPSSGGDSWHNENQDNNGRLFPASDCPFPEFSANSSAPTSSGWSNLDPAVNPMADSTFADLSLPWPARTPIAEWPLSSNLIWQNGYSEDDVNVSVNKSLPHNESSNVPPSLTQDKVFHQIWSQKSKRSVPDANTNPWDSNQQHMGTEANRENNATVIHISELVNDPGNWGTRPINQSVPWKTTPEDGDLHKPKPSSALLNSHQQLQESNVWKNEPPTGTNVWESHYEQIATRASCWPTQGRETPVTANAPGGGSPQASVSHQPQQSAIPSTLPQAEHDGGIWGLASSNFNSSFLSLVIVGVSPTHFLQPTAFQPCPSTSSHFGPPGGLFRRPIFGAGATGGSANRLAEDSSDLGLPSRAAWATISSAHLLNQEDNSWATVTGRCVAPTAIAGPTPSSASAAPSLFSVGCSGGLEDADQHQEVNTGVSMAAYRGDLVRYFLQQGFRREDVESVLAECNMDIDRSIAVLRLRSRNAVSGNAGTPRYPGTVGGPRRIPTSPTATGQFGYFPNAQSTSAAAAAVAPFGRGMPVSGGGGNRMPGAAASAGGDSILGSSLSSLLGLPPPQQQENGFSPMLIRGRNYQWQPTNAPPTNLAFIASIMELQRKRQVIVSPPFALIPVGSLYHCFIAPRTFNGKSNYSAALQLHQVENQISAREVSGAFASNPVPPPQPPVSTFWSNPEETRPNASSLTQRLQDLRIGAGTCSSNNNPAPSISNNPPSPRSVFRATTNGFRSPRHNSGTDNFAGNGGNLASGWLLIRGVPPSMSRPTLESFLGTGLLNLHPLPTRGTFVARFITPEVAMDVGFQLTANAPNSSPLLVTIIEERQAFDLIVEALNAVSGVNAVAAAAAAAAAASGGSSVSGGGSTN
ncbi:hypothetical protein EGR_03306 [Echinococcus granulosus]|uniref:UBA domain-containing protein n=1 Tax=Echinococcus granulosus TaxID=6210 RepID=W6UJP9_ECHGR|nr:hypothetical protein EGR_03306 [Echinococcus granulosus]EUB61760.1 hypothetical protein EGR_03306 [Echinococcus granulosus]